MMSYRRALVLATAALLAGCSDASQPTSPAEMPSPASSRKPGSTAGITVTNLSLSGSRSDSRAEDVDDQGRIVGSRGTFSGPLRAFLWTPTSPRATTGAAIDLGDLGGGAAQARGINAVGQIVGSSRTPTAGQHPFLWEGGTMHDLGIPAGMDFAEAMDVNDGVSRRVAGGVVSPDDRALIWTVSGTGAGFLVTAFDVLPGLSTSGGFAFALNDAGVVVGYSNVLSGYPNQPVSWSNPGSGWAVNPLARLPSAIGGVARDINTAGKVVGYNVFPGAGCTSRAVVWTAGNAAAAQLPTLSGGACAEASSINDAGQISGFSSDGRGALRAVLWRGLVAGGYSVTDLGAASEVLGMNEPSALGAVEVVGLRQSGNGATGATLWTIK
jgi:probable HAF family extracellular repeat protein